MARGDWKKKPRRDIYKEVTARIQELLDKGVAPWRQPIKRSAHGDGMPKRLSTGKNYRGINVFLLTMTSWAHGYESATTTWNYPELIICYLCCYTLLPMIQNMKAAAGYFLLLTYIACIIAVVIYIYNKY